MTATDLPTDRLLALIDVARHAPSVLNTQPWQFRVAGGAVRLYADWSRQLAALDPEGRELILSSGAALAVLRIAARHEGLEAHVEPFPDLDDPHLLAVVTFDAAAPPDDDRLLRAVHARHTHRQDVTADVPDADRMDALEAAAAAEGVWLRVLPEGRREAVAALVEEGVLTLGADADVRADLHAWLRLDGDPRPDGVRDADQGAWDRRAALRTPTRAVAAHKAALVREAPALLVLGTDRDGPTAWLRAGLALGHVLVEAADGGWMAAYANEPIEAGDALRERLAEAVGGGHPQLLFRLGRPASADGTPRRPLSDVACDDDAATGAFHSPSGRGMGQEG